MNQTLFQNLADSWYKQTGMYSSVLKKTQHPIYRNIVMMGKSAIPLILREMQRRPGFWFYALQEITGEDPVSPLNRKKVSSAQEDWLNWGKKMRYLD
jgi:hypothetical protein